MNPTSNHTQKIKQPGEFIDNFRIVDILYHQPNGASVIYLVRPQDKEEKIALKMLLSQEDADIEAFENEFGYLDRLNHRNIVDVFQFSSEKNYYTMEYIDGNTIFGFLSSNRSDETTFYRILFQLTSILRLFQRERLVYQDFKPGNILIRTDGKSPQVKLIDFGLIRPYYSGDPTAVSGTFGYIAPEVINGEWIDTRADIYSIGTVLYECLTGKPAFRAQTKQKTVEKQMMDNYTPIQHRNPDISPALIKIVETMMNHEPLHRYQLADEIISEIWGKCGVPQCAPRQLLLMPNHKLFHENPRLSWQLSEQLDKGEILAIVQQILGQYPIYLELLSKKLWKITHGMPHFICKTISHLVDNEVLIYDNGKWQIHKNKLSDAKPPRSIYDIFYKKLESVSRNEYQILSDAALIGEPIDIDLWKHILDTRDEDLQQYVAKFKSEEILYEDQENLFFIHPLLLQILLEEYPHLLLKRTHQDCATWLENRYPDPDPKIINRLARHYWNSEQKEKALPYLLRSAANFRENEDMEMAKTQYQRALECDLNEAQHIDVLMALSEIYGRKFEKEKAIQFLNTALDLSSDGKKKAEILWRLGKLYRENNDVEKAEEALNRGLTLLEDESGTEKIHLRNELAWLDAKKERIEAAMAIYAENLDALKDRDEPEILGKTYNFLGAVHQTVTHDQEIALEMYEKALASINETENRYQAGSILNNIGMIYLNLGDYEKSEDYFNQSLEIRRNMNDFPSLIKIYISLGALEKRRSNPNGAINWYRKAKHLSEAIGDVKSIAGASNNMAQIYKSLNEFSKAIGEIENATHIYLRLEDLKKISLCYKNLGNIYLKMKNYEKATSCFEESYRLSKKIKDEYSAARVEFSLANIYKKQKIYEKAERYYINSLNLFRRKNEKEKIAEAYFELSELYRLTQKIPVALKYIDKAIKLFTKIGEPSPLAYALREKGQIYRQMQQISTARKALDDSISILKKLGLDEECGITCAIKAKMLFDSNGWRRRGKICKELNTAIALGKRLLSPDSENYKQLAEIESEIETPQSGNKELYALYEVSKTLNANLDLPSILETTLDLLMDMLDVQHVMIQVYETESMKRKMVVHRNLDANTLTDAFGYSRSIISNTEKSEKPIIVNDAIQNDYYSQKASVREHQIKSIICAPLLYEDALIGTLYLDDRRTSHAFTQSDITFLETFANLAAVAIRNASIFQEVKNLKDRYEQEAVELRHQIDTSRYEEIVGKSEPMKMLFSLIDKIAPTTGHVLLTGETGTGKELVARAIHKNSPRADKAFITVNCAALPPHLEESELFGIEEGTATGVDRKIGKFEQAHGGTLFLDEVGDMSLSVQAKILRALQERCFQRIGGREYIHTDIRIVSATHHNLEKAVEAGKFREDLFYRLNVLPINVPPLRKRGDDVLLLLQHYFLKFEHPLTEKEKSIPLTVDALSLLLNYSWPGNVRELAHLVQRTVVLSGGKIIDASLLPAKVKEKKKTIFSTSIKEEKSLRQFTSDVRKEYCQWLLKKYKGDRKKICDILGISYPTLRKALGED